MGYLVRHKGVHDGDGDTLHLGDREISDCPMGGVGSADSDMIALFQTKGGKEIRYAAEFRIHLAVGIVVATGGVLGGAVFGEIAVRESGLVPVGADGFREDIEIIFSHRRFLGNRGTSLTSLTRWTSLTRGTRGTSLSSSLFRGIGGCFAGGGLLAPRTRDAPSRLAGSRYEPRACAL